MAKVFVYAEQRGGKLKKASFEIIAASAAAGNETEAVLLGSGVAGLADELGHYGATKVHVADSETLSHYNSEAYSKVLLQLIDKEKPEIFLASHTPTGRDLMPHISAKLDTGLASDCTELEFNGNSVKGARPVYAGKAIAEFELLGDGVKMVTVRPNALGNPTADSSKSAAKSEFSPDIGELKSKTTAVVQGTLTRPDVTEASIVVSAGRSIGNADNFKIVEELAEVLGAGVGASRAAVDAGYRPHRDQVGQTGKVVSPTLYIACGISGAIQHLAGMRTSKTIVAINTDPEAPIFKVADYGIVNDLFKVVPLLTEEFKRLKG